MRNIRKILALVLSVCMLIGMPLSIDVGAAEEELKVVSAILVPEYIATASELDATKTIHLYFNKAVTIDTATTGARVAAIYPNGIALSHAKSSIRAASNVFGATNHYIVETTGTAYTTLAETAAANNLSLVVRLYDHRSDYQNSTKDNYINGVTFDGKALAANTGNPAGCKGDSGLVNKDNSLNKADCLDIPVTTSDDAPAMTSAMWITENKIRVAFSETMMVKADVVSAGVRMVNAEGKTMYYNPTAEVKYSTDEAVGAEKIAAAMDLTNNSVSSQATIVETSSVGISGFETGSVKNYFWFAEHLKACKQENSGESFRLVFAVEDTGDKNWYIDGVTSAANGRPMMACSGKDVAYMDIPDYTEQVTVQRVEITDNQTIEVTFSHPVKVAPNLASGLWAGVRIVKNGVHNTSISATVGGNTYSNGQLGLGIRAPKTAGAEYDTVWTFKASGTSNLRAFASAMYFGKDVSKDHDLCMAFQVNKIGTDDGFVDSIVTEDGKKLSATSVSGIDVNYQPIKDDDFLYIEPTAVRADDTTFLITTGPVYSIGTWRDGVYLRAYDGEGNLLLINTAAAQWKIAITKMEPSGTTAAHMTGVIQEAHGVKNYSDITALLDEKYPNGYDLVLTVDGDTRVNGACENMVYYKYQEYEKGMYAYLRASKLYSTDTMDVAAISFAQSDIVSVTDVSVIDRPDGNKSVIVTFSHDIDMNAFLNAFANNGGSMWLSTSAVGVNNWVQANGTVGGSAPAKQTKLQNVARYGSSNNQIIGLVYESGYANVMNAVAKLKADYPNSAYEFNVAWRLEMATGMNTTTNVFPLNYNVKPVDSAVLSPMLHVWWEGGGRIFSEANGTKPQLTMQVEQKSDHTLVATFGRYIDGVFMPEAITINDTFCRPYIGLRLVNENNQLIYSTLENGVTVSTTSKGKPMQWTAQKYELSDDGTQLILTFSDSVSISDIMEKSNLPAGLKDYEIKLCIEESKTKNGITDPDCVIGNGKVWSIVSQTDPEMQLAANSNLLPTYWDGHYAEFSPLDPDAPIEVKDNAATITGQTTLTFEWTEAVDMGDSYRGVRFVNENNVLLYYNEETNTVSTAAVGTPLQWSVIMEYADSAKSKINVRLCSKGRMGVMDLSDLFEPDAGTEWAKIKALYNGGTFKICMEERNNSIPGIMEAFKGVDGKPVLAQPLVGDRPDAIWIDIKGELVRGDLTVTSVKAVSDTHIEVTFSAPIKILSNPYAAIRVYTKDDLMLYYNTLAQEFTTNANQVNAEGKPMYKDADGNPTTEATDAKGVKNTRIANIPMQWGGLISSISKDKTVIRYSIQGRSTGTILNGVTDILGYDWASIDAKAYFIIEDNGADMRTWNMHVDNVVRADNEGVALQGNHFIVDRDRFRTEVEIAYTANPIKAKAVVISDTQVRVTFSEPVNVGGTFWAIRLMDKEGKLMWSGKENASVPYQWTGTWKFENGSTTSAIWTIKSRSSILGAVNLHELLNWDGPLAQFKNQGDFYFAIEEKNETDNPVGRSNFIVETVSSMDGTNHLQGNASSGYDSFTAKLNVGALAGETLQLESVKALDEKTIRVKFNRDVIFKEGDETVTMSLRYLTVSGDSETLTDGKTANFIGTWEYEGEDKSTVIWTLTSKHTDSITEILTYGGNFKWNKGARIAFVIMDKNSEYYCPYQSMRINGITDATGMHHLVANYCTDDAMMVQMNVEVGYELPTVADEPTTNIVYISNYTPFVIVSVVAGMVILAVGAVILGKKKRR